MRKEDFFEVLGELDDDIVKGAKTIMKKKVYWKVWGTMAACLAIVAVLGIGGLQGGFMTNQNDEENVTSNIPDRPINLKPVINFEGVVTAVDGGRITLEDGKVILITDDTAFGGDPDTNNVVSDNIQVGNFIQGYTENDPDAEEVTASRIWTNEAPTVSGKRVINFEGRVVEAEENSVTLDNGKNIRIADDTIITFPDGRPAKITEGDYIQGYAENIEDSKADATYILITPL